MTKHHRSIWISDVHLGTRHAQVDQLLRFLKENDSDYLYLVGDFIDGWALRNHWHWANDYNVVLQKLLRKSRKSTKVIYVTGNHDEFLAPFCANHFGSLSLLERTIHLAADGKRYLVIHGHQFDGLVRCNRLLERIGSHLYDAILSINTSVNRAARKLGLRHKSFAAYIKSKTKSAVQYVTNYEECMTQMARRTRVDGVICGHIHRPEIRQIDDLTYLNCGDWVESCSALVEDSRGHIELVHFLDELPVKKPAPVFQKMMRLRPNVPNSVAISTLR